MDGTIELERLDNVLYVGRPAFGQENSTVSLFKLTGPAEKPDAAERVQVKFGRSSVNTIEVVERPERRRPCDPVRHVGLGRPRRICRITRIEESP